MIFNYLTKIVASIQILEPTRQLERILMGYYVYTSLFHRTFKHYKSKITNLINEIWHVIKFYFAVRFDGTSKTPEKSRIFELEWKKQAH